MSAIATAHPLASAREARLRTRAGHVAATAGVPFAITHSPGRMFATDIPDAADHV